MALLLPERGLLFTAAPGTGSTSMLSALTQRYGGRPVPVADVVVDGVTVLDQKHATAAQLVAAGVLDGTGGLQVVTTIRNPFDYWPSEWLRTRTRWLAEVRDPESWVHRQPGMLDRIVDAVEMEFPVWLLAALDDVLAAGRQHHLNEGHIAEADRVCRMEALGDDLAEVLGEPIMVEHQNRTSQRAPYWQYYDVDARAAVAEVFAPTIARFDYTF